MLQEIATTLGLSALLVSAVAWLARSIIMHVLSKDIEKFKLQLQKAIGVSMKKLLTHCLKCTVGFTHSSAQPRAMFRNLNRQLSRQRRKNFRSRRMHNGKSNNVC
jgi:hypothetical protein